MYIGLDAIGSEEEPPQENKRPYFALSETLQTLNPNLYPESSTLNPNAACFQKTRFDCHLPACIMPRWLQEGLGLRV